jgi:hypothetical protein
VWNFDEIGFRIGCLRGRVVIVPADVKAIYLADPDNRESITVLECVSAGGNSISPLILMKGEILMEKHVLNRLSDDVIIGATHTDFTNDVRSYQWLQHFDKHTRDRAEGRYRALVMDGHGSHVSEHFKHYCWRNKIVPFLLLPHSTHLCQPLDVGVFSAMKDHHQNALYESVRFGDFTFDRTDFLDAFQDIHNLTMRSRTIYGDWAETGLFPFDPEVVLSKMRKFDGFSATHAVQALVTSTDSEAAVRCVPFESQKPLLTFVGQLLRLPNLSNALQTLELTNLTKPTSISELLTILTSSSLLLLPTKLPFDRTTNISTVRWLK